jgi:ATP-dependent DNA helicase RecQ
MPAPATRDLRQIVRDYWGFASLRPLQERAMRAVLDRRDSLVVLPTGGGKSLCYQAPAAARLDEITVVVSPLIALMKDQVDALTSLGVPARAFNSALSDGERTATLEALRTGAVRLLYVSPERLALDGFRRVLASARARTFAIDEAHCISHWGHDFRPEYRQLGRLREWFPDASVHAFTATATEPVRADIAAQLGLNDPEVMVGSFDRPNLTYRVVPRSDQMAQVREVLNRHDGEAGIIYCIRRKDVDELTDQLRRDGINALPYHAGMAPEDRKASQDAFRSERCDLVVATVAFGMGIDRSNIRFVLHTGMPKSLEHYQQEAGRAGRDGLPAECVLLASGRDVVTWKSIITKSAAEAEAEVDPAFVANALRALEAMDGYCRRPACRHRMLVEHFGQGLPGDNCGACDFCLGDIEFDPDSTRTAQMILSCVARLKESFGVKHVVTVLRGERADGVVRRGHDTLSTFGLLREHPERQVRDWVWQLVTQCVLVQSEGEYPVLRLTPEAWEVMRGKREARLTRRAVRKRKERATAEEVSWEGVDRALFDALRALRRELAEAAGKPPYTIFSDATLREMARRRPTTPSAMHRISGVGEVKLRELGDQFLSVIRGHCDRHGVSADVAEPVKPPTPRAGARPVPAGTEEAFALFRGGSTVAEVMTAMDRASGTVVEWLSAYIERERPADVSAWVDDDTYQRVAAAVRRVGGERLKPIFLELGQAVSYDTIRVVLSHLAAVGVPGGRS